MHFNTCIMFLGLAMAYQAVIIGGQGQDWQMNRQNRVNDGLNNLMSINIPMFYDMVRNGSSMGLNVLSGMVKVERGDEAERNGLMGNGRRPLSVRIFGIPVYERGLRVRPPQSDSSRPKGNGEEEDASVEPLAI